MYPGSLYVYMASDSNIHLNTKNNYLQIKNSGLTPVKQFG